MPRIHGLGALALLAVAGCVLGPAPWPESTSPAPPAEPPAAPVSADNAPSRPLALDEVIRQCLLADPRLRAGVEEVTQAHADLVTSSVKPNPELFTDIQLLPLTRAFSPERTGGPPQFDFEVSYPIDWFLFGKRAAAMLAAGHGVHVAETNFANLVRLRVTEAVVGFYDVLEARGLVDVARQDVDNLRQAEASLRKAVEAGGRPQVELNRIRLDLLRSQQVVREAEATLARARARLRALLGRKDRDPDFDVRGELDLPPQTDLPDAEAAFQAATEQRPDLQALRWRVSRAEADVELERKKAYPEVKPALAYNRQFQRAAIGQPDANAWSAGVTATLPFFDRNQGNRLKAQSVLAQRHAELHAGLVDLRAEVEQLSQDLRTADANARAIAGEQLGLARQVRDSITSAYKAGGRTLLDFLDAQRNYRETFRLYITGRANYWRSYHRFQSAVGQQVQLK